MKNLATKDWTDLDATEEWKQYEIEEKKNRDIVQMNIEAAKKR